VLAGCGGDDDEPASPTPTATPTPTPTGTPTAFAPSAPEPPEDAPEAQPGGAGDEEPARQRVRLTIVEDGIRPQRVEVTAFLGVRLDVRNDTRREQLVTVVGARPPRALSLGRGVRATLDIDGLRPGRYRIRGEPAGAATLVVKRSTP
jgi:hypothetical protein